MLAQNLYGVVIDSNALLRKHSARVEPLPAFTPKTRYAAKIVAWREYKDFELVVPVIDGDGDLVGDPQFQIAVAWGNMDSGRPNFSFDARYPIAETFSLPEMLEGAPIIHAGTGAGGPPYRVFVTDDDGEVASEIAHVGWVDNHISLCPIFQVVKLSAILKEPTPAVPGPAPVEGDADKILRKAQEIVSLGLDIQKLVSH